MKPAVKQQAILLLVSLGVHAGLVVWLGSVVVFSALEKTDPLVAVTIQAPDEAPLARPLDDVLGSIARHAKQVDRTVLESVAPDWDPTTVALPSAPVKEAAIWPVPGIEGPVGGGGDDALDRALAALRLPTAGQRGAFEGTVYRFRSIRRVRDAGGRWFQGSGRMEGRDRLYTYVCQFPGRPPSETDTGGMPWIGMDYRATVRWPEDWGGRYAFRLTADGGAIFQIDGVDVVNHDGNHGFSPRENEADIPAGVRRLRLAFIQGPRSTLGLILHYRPVAEKHWRVFDLRPLLIGSRQQRTNPVVDAETTLEEIL